MKKKLILLSLLLGWQTSNAANLTQVYSQALISDPIFQQAIAQSLVTRENVPISLAAILPSLNASFNPTVTRIGYSGTAYQISSFNNIYAPRNLTERTYTLNLTLTQPIFNFALFANYAQQLANAKGACATLNAALQSLMVRVSNAYFAILKDEDNLSYAAASQRSYAQQLKQTQQQYRVGLKTLTDVYTAQASYDSASAQYIAAQTSLVNDRENLRVMTGVYYENLSPLRKDFPLVTPDPQDVDAWVKTALEQNWAIKAAKYGVQAAHENIRVQFAGNLPTVNLQAQVIRQYENNLNPYHAFTDRNGPGTSSQRAIGLNFNFPIFSGGSVLAQTRQANDNYQLQDQVLEQTVRDTINQTRQSYRNLDAGISQIKADEQAIKSAQSSLHGLEASYQAGTETLLDVLNQQQRVYESQKTYATDRYDFINNLLRLKQAAGTLSFDDLKAINAWLK